MRLRLDPEIFLTIKVYVVTIYIDLRFYLSSQDGDSLIQRSKTIDKVGILVKTSKAVLHGSTAPNNNRIINFSTLLLTIHLIHR